MSTPMTTEAVAPTLARATPGNQAEFAAVLLATVNSLRPTEKVPSHRPYLASLNALALTRLRSALTDYKPEDGKGLLACAEMVERSHRLPPMTRLHIGDALRAVVRGDIAGFIAAEFVTAAMLAEVREDTGELLGAIGQSGLSDIATELVSVASAIGKLAAVKNGV